MMGDLMSDDRVYWPYTQSPDEILDRVGELERKIAGQHAALLKQEKQILSLKKRKEELEHKSRVDDAAIKSLIAEVVRLEQHT